MCVCLFNCFLFQFFTLWISLFYSFYAYPFCIHVFLCYFEKIFTVLNTQGKCFCMKCNYLDALFLIFFSYSFWHHSYSFPEWLSTRPFTKLKYAFIRCLDAFWKLSFERLKSAVILFCQNGDCAWNRSVTSLPIWCHNITNCWH